MQRAVKGHAGTTPSGAPALRRVAASAIVLVGLAAPPSAEAAPTLAFDRDCYAEGALMVFSGEGFSPGGKVRLVFSHPSGSFGTYETTAQPSGALAGRVRAPSLEDFAIRGSRMLLGVSANDDTRIAAGAPPEEQFAGTLITVSRLGAFVAPWATVGPAIGRPRAMTTVRATGWSAFGKVLYAHYRRSGKTVKSVRVGALTGPCGDLTKRMRQFPFRPVPAGTYRVIFTTRRTYNPNDMSFFYRAVRVRPRDAVR